MSEVRIPYGEWFNSLTEKQQKIHKANRMRYFKTTYLLSGIYLGICTIVLSTMFSSIGREFFGKRYFWFTVILVAGMVAIALSLLGMAMGFRTTFDQKSIEGRNVCPDYYDLKELPEGTLQAKPGYGGLTKYACYPKNDVFGNTSEPMTITMSTLIDSQDDMGRVCGAPATPVEVAACKIKKRYNSAIEKVGENLDENTMHTAAVPFLPHLVKTIDSDNKARCVIKKKSGLAWTSLSCIN